MDTGFYVLSSERFNLWVLFQHAFYLAVMCGALGYFAVNSKSQQEMVLLLNRVTANDDKLDFSFDMKAEDPVAEKLIAIILKTKQAIAQALHGNRTIRKSTDGIYEELDQLKGLSSGQFNESSLIATSAEEISVTLEEMSRLAQVALEKVNAATGEKYQS